MNQCSVKLRSLSLDEERLDLRERNIKIQSLFPDGFWITNEFKTITVLRGDDKMSAQRRVCCVVNQSKIPLAALPYMQMGLRLTTTFSLSWNSWGRPSGNQHLSQTPNDQKTQNMNHQLSANLNSLHAALRRPCPMTCSMLAIDLTSLPFPGQFHWWTGFHPPVALVTDQAHLGVSSTDFYGA
jgi:hypothetical protein